MSDFFIYLEDQGIIESTTWAFENLSDEQMDDLIEKYMDAYLHEVRVVRAEIAATLEYGDEWLGPQYDTEGL